MSKLPGPPSGLRPPSVSRLVVPPGSLVKRNRGESMDLEAGMEAKKPKMSPPHERPSNLTSMKSKSKSMMHIAGRPSVRAAPTKPAARPGMASKAAPPDRRATTSRALNDKSNALNKPAASKPTASKPAAPAGKGGARRPAWDLKGRLEDMEAMFRQTNTRVTDLEMEKTQLETDVEVKKTVVVQNSEEIKELRQKITKSEEEVESLKKKLREKEDEYSTETTKLKRQLEDETFIKTSLERKLKSLEDELDSKQAELRGLKTAVAEMTSSRAGLEAGLSTAKMELEGSRANIVRLEVNNADQAARLGELEDKLRWEETQRRKLHNMVQELKGNIRVFCRVRPLLGEETANGKEITHIMFDGEKNLELIKKEDNPVASIAQGLNKNMKYDFEFDQVFGPGTSQAKVFEELSQLVQSALDGYNVCVFAYGQTGSGKTFTMEGGQSEEQAGMIPKTIQQIFEETQRLVEKGWSYKLEASFLEIYNEEIRDLLATEKNLKYDVKMADSKGADVYVTNLKVEEVTSEDQIAHLLKRATKNRAVAATNMNERSSRSHSVFMLKITGTNSHTSETCCGTLNLVDLAGSERLKDSGSEGKRLTETQNINKSLANLGNVIMALGQKNAHIPYRNSRLTHLLQNSLGGNSKTLMFVNLNPKEDCFNETLNSLRFATKVNQCNIGTATKKSK